MKNNYLTTILSVIFMLMCVSLFAQDQPAYNVDPETGLVTGVYTPAEANALQKLNGTNGTPTELEIPQFREITSSTRNKYVNIDLAEDGSGQSFAKRRNKLDKQFEGFGFLNNAEENGGFLFIPPDPIAAAGKSRLVAVVNCMVECRW
jgi:hypothetical protein